MKLGLRRFVLACVVAASAIAVLVPGGSAGNRSADVTFEAFPGPTAVTYGENIAYRATFTNTSGSMLTHVTFRMRVPYVDLDPNDSVLDAEAQTPPVESTCPVNGGQGITVPLSTGGHEWQCDLGSFSAGTAGQDPPQVTLTVVWRAPTLSQTEDCGDCLLTYGRFTAKEGTNDVSDPNDAFYPPGGGPDVLTSATLIPGDSSGNTTEAGGYETDVESCTNPLGPGSLHTNRSINGTSNAVSTTVCLPPPVPKQGPDLGLVTTILEGVGDPGDPGHQYLGRSTVCVAELGENCDGDYTPHNFVNDEFGTDDPMTLVFRIADAALKNGDKITQVWHDGALLPTCGVGLTNCVVSIERSGGPVKIYTLVVLADENGFYNW